LEESFNQFSNPI